MSDESLFLEAVKAAPDDLSLRLVYADWLEERGDARCEYLRVDGELQKVMGSEAASVSPIGATQRELRARLKKIAKTLDPAWVALVDALRPQVFRCRACRKVLSAKEAIDTDPRGYRKMKTSRYCKLCFESAVRAQIHRGTNSFGTPNGVRFDYHGRTSDDE